MVSKMQEYIVNIRLFSARNTQPIFMVFLRSNLLRVQLVSLYVPNVRSN